MMGRRFLRSRRGNVSVEAAVSVALVLTLLVGILDALLAFTVAANFDSAVASGARRLAVTRSVAEAEAALRSEMLGFARSCVGPVEVRLYNGTGGLDFTDPLSGYRPDGGNVPKPIRAGRFSATCEWRYMTPLVSSIVGAQVGIVRTEVVVFE